MMKEKERKTYVHIYEYIIVCCFISFSKKEVFIEQTKKVLKLTYQSNT